MTWQRKDERINIRVTKEEKQDILKAVEKFDKDRSQYYQHQTISSFLIKQARLYIDKKI